MMTSWSFLASHARVLLRIAHDAAARRRDIAASLDIIERSGSRDRGGFQRAGQLSPEAPRTYLPAGPRPEQRHAGRATPVGRGRSRHRGRRLRPAGPRHRRCAREDHAERRAPRRRVLVDSDEVVASPEPKGRRRAGRGSSGERSTRPGAARTRRRRSSAAGRAFGARESARDQPVT